MFKGRRTRIFVPILLILVILGGGAIWLKMQSANDAMASADSTATEESATKDEDEEAPVPVELSLATSRDLPSYFNATGSLEARRRVDLISKAQGQITKLLVEEGDYVKVGQVILELEHRQESLLAQQARVRSSTAQLELDRMKGMAEQQLVTDREFEEKKQNAEIAVYEHELAQVRLEEKIVKAPFAGRITTRNVELGQTVGVGEALVGIADVLPLELKLYLPEKIVQDLKIGQPVEIRPDVGESVVFSGSVDRIAPVVDPATSTVKVTLRVVESGQGVRVGSFVRARITTDVHEEVVAIPKKALVPEAGATFAFVAESDSVRKIEVTTGYADDEYIEIEGGIEVGEQVVVVGQGGLRQGTKIRDLNAELDEVEEAEKTSSDEADDAAQVAQAGSR